MKQVATPTAIAIGGFFLWLLSQPTKEFNLDSPLPENPWIPGTFSISKNGKDK